MNHTCFLASVVLALIIPATCWARQNNRNEQRIELRGKIQTKNNSNGLEASYCIQWGGNNTTSDKEGFFTIPLAEEPAQLFLLICKPDAIRLDREHNTIRGMVLDTTKRFLLYEKQEDGSWQQLSCPESADNTYDLDDEHTVLVYIDPKYVQSVSAWRLNLAPHIIKLPLITMHPNVKVTQSPKSLFRTQDSRWVQPLESTRKTHEGPEVKHGSALESFLVN